MIAARHLVIIDQGRLLRSSAGRMRRAHRKRDALVDGDPRLRRQTRRRRRRRPHQPPIDQRRARHQLPDSPLRASSTPAATPPTRPSTTSRARWARPSIPLPARTDRPPAAPACTSPPTRTTALPPKARSSGSSLATLHRGSAPECSPDETPLRSDLRPPLCDEIGTRGDAQRSE